MQSPTTVATTLHRRASSDTDGRFQIIFCNRKISEIDLRIKP
jgi:hypothetical protein